MDFEAARDHSAQSLQEVLMPFHRVKAGGTEQFQSVARDGRAVHLRYLDAQVDHTGALGARRIDEFDQMLPVTLGDHTYELRARDLLRDEVVQENIVLMSGTAPRHTSETGGDTGRRTGGRKPLRVDVIDSETPSGVGERQSLRKQYEIFYLRDQTVARQQHGSEGRGDPRRMANELAPSSREGSDTERFHIYIRAAEVRKDTRSLLGPGRDDVERVDVLRQRADLRLEEGLVMAEIATERKMCGQVSKSHRVARPAYGRRPPCETAKASSRRAQ